MRKWTYKQYMCIHLLFLALKLKHSCSPLRTFPFQQYFLRIKRNHGCLHNTICQLHTWDSETNFFILSISTCVFSLIFFSSSTSLKRSLNFLVCLSLKFSNSCLIFSLSALSSSYAAFDTVLAFRSRNSLFSSSNADSILAVPTNNTNISVKGFS